MSLFSKSEAEKIYNAWNTNASSRAVKPAARATGAFDKYREQGGFQVIITRLTALMRKIGSSGTAEQIWKLLDKIRRRKGDVISRELLKEINKDNNLRTLMAQFPATMFGNLSDDAVDYAKALDPNNITFPKTGKQVKVLKKLGAGGMGGAVFLAEDSFGNKYALKHFLRAGHKIEGYGGSTPRNMLDKTGQYLMKYFEAALTTTCIDALTIGRDEYVLLQLGEGDVDYTGLNMSDLQSVFSDMQKLFEFSKHYMTVDVTQDVSVLHMDIHGENFMRFGGKLRLIDFGQAMIFSPGQDELVRSHEQIKYDRNNQKLYLQNVGALEDKARAYNQNASSWKKYIEDWQKAYAIAPIVQVCQGCSRQYPAGLKITECFRCGSKKIENSKLRRADIEATARLKGISPSMVGSSNPYATGTVSSVNPQQYGCIVLTAVLIKEIWAGTEKGTDKGMGGQAARAIQNVEVYSRARSGQYKFREQGQAGIVEVLLLWYDEMMRRLFDGETFSARDAVTFLGGSRGTTPSRTRRHSVAF